jgi:hypothetical protein
VKATATYGSTIASANQYAPDFGPSSSSSPMVAGWTVGRLREIRDRITSITSPPTAWGRKITAGRRFSQRIPLMVRDGKSILFGVGDGTVKAHGCSARGHRKPVPLTQNTYVTNSARFSPDGHWSLRLERIRADSGVRNPLAVMREVASFQSGGLSPCGGATGKNCFLVR